MSVNGQISERPAFRTPFLWAEMWINSSGPDLVSVFLAAGRESLGPRFETSPTP